MRESTDMTMGRDDIPTSIDTRQLSGETVPTLRYYETQFTETVRGHKERRLMRLAAAGALALVGWMLVGALVLLDVDQPFRPVWLIGLVVTVIALLIAVWAVGLRSLDESSATNNMYRLRAELRRRGQTIP